MKKDRKMDVEVQKGKIISNPPTVKQMPYPERVKEREMEQKNTRWGQYTELKTPKRK